jgi:hypothetical protein
VPWGLEKIISETSTSFLMNKSKSFMECFPCLEVIVIRAWKSMGNCFISYKPKPPIVATTMVRGSSTHVKG